jgi:hypothetical protein
LGAFDTEDLLHVLDEFEGDKNVKLMTVDDFLARCDELGLPALEDAHIQSVIRILGKPQLGNAIRLSDLETVMSNFMPDEPPKTKPKKDKKKI